MRKLAAGLLAFVTTLACVATPVRAQTSAPEYSLDIPRQPLVDALRAFSLQTGLQLGYLTDVHTSGKNLAGPLKGRYTAESALTKLLATSGLAFKRVNERTIAVAAAAPMPPRRNGRGTEGSADDRPPARPYLAAQIRPPGSGEHGGGVRIERVLVTGSRLERSGEGPAPVMIFDRQRIDEFGVSTVAEVLEYVPQQPYARPAGYRASGAQYAEIRGLGVDTTLVLINGRRTAPTATSVALNAFDLNTIPLAAVERVEVLSDSAAAVYGADAVGGVVNIILKKAIPDPVIDLKYGAADGGADERRVSFSVGHNGDRLRGSIALDYFERGFLLGEARDRWSNQDYRRFGSADRRSLNANPGNITSMTSANLPGLPSRFAAAPDGSTGVAMTPADFLSTAGDRNLDSVYRFWSVVPETDRASAVASAEFDLAPRLTAFGEFLYADRASTFQFDPPMLAGAIVPATNAFNPFGVPVAVNYRFDEIGPRHVIVDTELFRTVAGLRGTLDSWAWEFSALRTDEDGASRIEGNVDAARVGAALAAADPTRALNVFRDGPGGSPQLLASLLAAPQEGRYVAKGTQVSGFVRGPLLALPAGALDAVIGAEWREEDVLVDDAAFVSRDRMVSAGFAELNVPVVSSAMRVPAVEELSLTVAARLDHYSDFGASLNPQFGVLWRPLADLALRASYGTSFRPPSMFELFAPRTTVPAQIPDPRRNNEIASITFVSGGNADLDPMKARSLTAGFVFTPEAVDGMRIAANYWRVSMNNRVMVLPVESFLADEAQFANRIVRAPPTTADVAAGLPGSLMLVDISRGNFGELQTDGIDLQASYAFDTSFGRFTPRVTATWVGGFATSDLPATTPTDRVGVGSSLGTIPRWRAVAAVGWRQGGLGLSTTVRFVPSYDDTVGSVRTGRVIPSQTIVDLQASLDLDDVLRGSFWQGFRISAGMMNLFDEQPPFAELGLVEGYDSSQGDLRQRFGYLKLSRSF